MLSGEVGRDRRYQFDKMPERLRSDLIEMLEQVTAVSGEDASWMKFGGLVGIGGEQ